VLPHGVDEKKKNKNISLSICHDLGGLFRIWIIRLSFPINFPINVFISFTFLYLHDDLSKGLSE